MTLVHGPRSGLRVRDLMSPEVFTVKLEESVSHVRRLMQERRIHCLPVLDDFSNVVGVVTSSDLLGSRVEEERARVSHVMQRHVHALPKDADVTLLARVMASKRIHHVVVLEHGKVLGIVSSFDLLKLLADANLATLATTRLSEGGAKLAERGQQQPPTTPPRPAPRAAPPSRPRAEQAPRSAPPPTGPSPDSVSAPEFREDPPAAPPRPVGLDAGFDLDPADEDELGLILLDAAPDEKVADPLEFGEGI